MCDKWNSLCTEKKCRYYLKWEYINNCVLCVSHSYRMEDIGIIQGVSRQRIDQIEKRAMGKLRKRWGRYLKEAVAR